MSFLNSVLSSINNGKTQITAPQVRSPKPEQPASDKPSVTGTAKRKASSELSQPNDRAAKPFTSSQSIAIPSNSRVSQPVSGTPATSAIRRPAPAAALAATSKAAPKKGSFQEIMARANAAGQVGQLTHKPKTKEQLSMKKELALKKEIAKQGKKGSHSHGLKGTHMNKLGAQPSPAAATASASKQTGQTPKSSRPTGYQGTVKQRPQPAYQGTAKGKAPVLGYKGTSKPGGEIPQRRDYETEPDRKRSMSQHQRKRSYNDIESGSEENQSDDGYKYASSDYSDMDAGFDDVDEEEAAAERLAKLEDIREKKRLDELARLKELKKKKAQGGA